jgi:signal transduction histidine kinase
MPDDTRTLDETPRVLVVDSEPKVVQTVATLLRQEGYEVDTGLDLASALPMLTARVHDVLLTELGLADMGLLGEVRERSPTTVCVVLTAYATVESAVAALRRGAYDYLIKPCVVEDLRQTIRRAIAQRRTALLAAQRERELRELNDQLEERVRSRTADLAQANHRLEEANAAKDRFLATLSHELRTPLTPLRASLDLLKMHMSEELRPMLEPMERSLAHETRLIDDLLDMARITAGKLTVRKQATDLLACLQTAVQTVWPRAQAKGVTVALHFEADLPNLLADGIRIQQVACNLLDNAIKFTPAGGRVVAAVSRARDRATVTVSDTGPGIAPEFLPHVFEPLRQADSSTRRQQSGLGLGLAIARQIVELHGGDLQAENLQPSGARFTFTVPIVRVPPRSPDPAPIDLGRLRILLVDDSLDTVDVLSRLLAARGLPVRQAGSVRRALELARNDVPDVIITDIGMPDEDGYDLLEQVRGDERLRAVPVVAATGYVGCAEQARMAERGFAASLSKPFDLDELMRTLDRVRRSGDKAQDGESRP